MADQVERLGLILNLAEQGMDIVHSYANDPMDAGAIQTGSGPIKNLKQVSADIKSDGEAAIDVAVTELIDALKTETSVSALIDGLTDTAALAEQSAARAVVAADSANATGKIYPSTAIGLLPANTAPGQYFSVPSPNASEYLILYQNVNGVAIERKRYPSALLVAFLEADYRATLVSGDSSRAHYWGGVFSKSGMIGVGFRMTDGHPIFADGRDLLGDVADLRGRLNIVSAPRGGVLLGFKTPSGRLLGHFDAHTGAWMTQGRNALVEIDRTNLRLKLVEAALDGTLPENPIDEASFAELQEAVASLQGMVHTVSSPRGGVLLGFTTPSGRLLGHFDAHTGAWMTGGRNALSEIDRTNLRLKSLEAAMGNPLADFPTVDWAFWGDSLTALGSSGNWASKLVAMLGVDGYNGGWGGQAFRQIAARQGATPSLMTVVGGTIPGDGPVAVTTNAYYPASNGGSVSGVLSGLLGTYTRTADGLSSTFTRTVSGAPVASPANAVFAPLYGTTMRDRHVVLWSGANSVYYEANQYDIISSIRSMIDYLTPRVKRVIVMEIPPSAARTLPAAPGSEREKLEKFNAMLKAAFPEYFLDIASWLRTQAAATAAGIVFTAQDLTDISNGVTPTSFTTDGLHFSDACGTAIAYRVRQEAITRGWIA